MPLTNTEIEMDGILTVYEQDKEARENLINEEEADPPALLRIFDDGSTIRLDAADIAFSEFATELAFMQEFSENPDEYVVEETDWQD